MRPWVVGLTGGVASGKSALANELVGLGAALVDTDVLARDVVKFGSEGLAEVAAHFGEEILQSDGSLNRRALRQRVFADYGARHALEAILHPRIRHASLCAVNTTVAPYVVLAVPLLVESKQQYDWVARVLVIDCDPAVQRARLQARDGVGPELADQMLAAQVSRDNRLAIADEVVRNSGSLDALRLQARCCHRRYLTLASQ